LFYRENGVAGTVGRVPLPAVGSTLDLVIRGTAGTLTVYYSVDGAALVQVGSARTPAARSAWFSTASKAGIEVSNTGSASPITATFSRLSITG